MRSCYAWEPPQTTERAGPVPSGILDHFVGQGPITPEELEATARRFKKAVIERALGGELTHHLGDAAGAAKPDDTTNHCNGTSEKTVLTDDGPLTIDVPATCDLYGARRRRGDDGARRIRARSLGHALLHGGRELALRNISAAWSRSSPAWRPAMNQFAILDGDRFSQPTI